MITTIPESRPDRTEVTLPWPPTVNTYWRRVGNKTLISRAGRQYRDYAESQAYEMDRRQWPLKGRLQVVINAYPPDKRRRDLDNILKALLDALGHIGLYQDDSQIDRIEVIRCPMGGYVDVKIEEIT